jgi:hypothetical protein
MEIDYVSVEMMEIDQAVFTIREVPSWARPIMDFLVDGQVPADKIHNLFLVTCWIWFFF